MPPRPKQKESQNGSHEQRKKDFSVEEESFGASTRNQGGRARLARRGNDQERERRRNERPQSNAENPNAESTRSKTNPAEHLNDSSNVSAYDMLLKMGVPVTVVRQAGVTDVPETLNTKMIEPESSPTASFNSREPSARLFAPSSDLAPSKNATRTTQAVPSANAPKTKSKMSFLASMRQSCGNDTEDENEVALGEAGIYHHALSTLNASPHSQVSQMNETLHYGNSPSASPFGSPSFSRPNLGGQTIYSMHASPPPTNETRKPVPLGFSYQLYHNLSGPTAPHFSPSNVRAANKSDNPSQIELPEDALQFLPPGLFQSHYASSASHNQPQLRDDRNNDMPNLEHHLSHYSSGNQKRPAFTPPPGLTPQQAEMNVKDKLISSMHILSLSNSIDHPPKTHIPPYTPPPRRNLPPDVFLDGPFTKQVNDLCFNLSPTVEEMEKRKATMHYMGELVRSVFGPESHLHQFGSTASGMSLRGAADMDLCIELSDRLKERFEVERLATLKKLEDEYALALKEWELIQQDVATNENDDHSPSIKSVEQDTLSKSNAENQNHDDHTSKKPKKPKLSIAQLVLERLGSRLTSEDGRISDIKVLINTRIPIIKFKDMLTGMNVDVGYDNLLAVYNTQLLQTYSNIDLRFKQLVMVIKFWAKRRSINDTYSGTLSSYAYVIMVIHFLQYACSPPILPPLQVIGCPKDPSLRRLYCSADGQTFDIDYFKDIAHLQAVWPFADLSRRNQTSIGRLVYNFFHYWAHEFDYRDHVVSIRTGGLLLKKDKDWVPFVEKKKMEGDVLLNENNQDTDNIVEKGGDVDYRTESKALTETAHVEDGQKQENEVKPIYQRYWVCIEDPFEITHNLGRPVGRDSLYFIRGEFLVAIKILHNSRNFPQGYVSALYNNVHIPESRHPPLLAQICEETNYKTREEHKNRNKENKAMSEKRRGDKKVDEDHFH